MLKRTSFWFLLKIYPVSSWSKRYFACNIFTRNGAFSPALQMVKRGKKKKVITQWHVGSLSMWLYNTETVCSLPNTKLSIMKFTEWYVLSHERFASVTHRQKNAHLSLPHQFLTVGKYNFTPQMSRLDENRVLPLTHPPFPFSHWNFSVLIKFPLYYYLLFYFIFLAHFLLLLTFFLPYTFIIHFHLPRATCICMHMLGKKWWGKEEKQKRIQIEKVWKIIDKEQLLETCWVSL